MKSQSNRLGIAGFIVWLLIESLASGPLNAAEQLPVVAAANGPAAEAGRAHWAQRHRDPENTGRADFTVPTNRMNGSFFEAIRWQKLAPGSPNEG